MFLYFSSYDSLPLQPFLQPFFSVFAMTTHLSPATADILNLFQALPANLRKVLSEPPWVQPILAFLGDAEGSALERGGLRPRVSSLRVRLLTINLLKTVLCEADPVPESKEQVSWETSLYQKSFWRFSHLEKKERAQGNCGLYFLDLMTVIEMWMIIFLNVALLELPQYDEMCEDDLADMSELSSAKCKESSSHDSWSKFVCV